MGRTISKIAADCSVPRDLLVTSTARSMSYFSPPAEEQWRIPLLIELLGARDKQLEIPEVETDDIDFMIKEICSN